MFKCPVILALFCVAAVHCVPAHECRGGVYTKDGRCYWVLSGSWLIAEDSCQGLGGHLADIQSASYIDFKAIVQHHLQRQIALSKMQDESGHTRPPPTGKGDDLFWTGGVAHEGAWKWNKSEFMIAGMGQYVDWVFKVSDKYVWTNMSYTNWLGGRAPPAKDGQCVAVNAISGKWQAMDCTRTWLPAICNAFTYKH